MTDALRAGIDETGPGRAFQIEHQIEAVGENAAGQNCMHIPRVDRAGLRGGSKAVSRQEICHSPIVS